MAKREPLDYLDLADFLLEENEYTKALWDNSALYDLTQRDENENYISPNDEDRIKFLNSGAPDAVKERINNIIEAYPEWSKASIAHSPPSHLERLKFGAGETLKDYTAGLPLSDGESSQWNSFFASITGGGIADNKYEKKSFYRMIDNFQSWHDDKNELIKSGIITDPEEISKVQDLGDFLQRYPDEAEEVSSKGTDRKYIKLKNQLPFILKLGNQRKEGFVSDPTVERTQDTWFGEWLKDSNTDFHKNAIAIKNEHERRHKEDPRYQAYKEHLSKQPTEFYERWTPNDYWFDTFYQMAPSLIALIPTAAAGVAGTAVGGPVVGVAAASAVSLLTHGPMVASQYPQTFKEAEELYGDKDLAKEIAEGATAASIVATMATEAIPTTRLAKMALPATAYKNTQRALNSSIRNKIFNAIGEDGIAKIGGTKWQRGAFHVLNASKQAALEGLQESVQYTADALILRNYKGTKFTEEFSWDEAQEALLGGIMMGSLTGAGFSLVGGKKAYTREQAKTFVDQITDEGRISPEDIISVAMAEEGLTRTSRDTEGGDTATRNKAKQDAKLLPTISETSESSLRGYVDEVLSSGTGKRVQINIEKVEDERDKNLIKELDKIDVSRQFEKLSKVLKRGGTKFVETLSPEQKEKVNNLLLGNIERIDKNILGIIKNKDNVINDFASGKLSVDFKVNRTSGDITTPIDRRKISVNDKKYADSLIKKYENQISEEVGDNVSDEQISKWFSDKNIDISKSSLETKKQKVTSKEGYKETSTKDDRGLEAFSQLPGMPFEGGKIPTKSKVSSKKKPIKAAEQIPVGSTVAILQKGNKFSGTTGEVVKYDSVKDRVKVKLFDSEKQKDMFYTFDAKKDVALMPDKPKTDKPKEAIYDVKVDMYENPNVQDKTGDNQDVWVVDNLKEAKEQLKSIKSGLGKGKNFANKIEKFEDHYILKHKKGDDKHIYIKGTEPEGLISDTKGRVKGEPYLIKKDIKETKEWSRYKPKGKENFEVSSQGTALGKQFSAFNAKLNDGRTIEEAYQVGVKGYSSIKEGKGKPPKDKNIDTYTEYKKLWQQWAKENPRKMEDLISASKGKVLTDKFAKTDVSQARALAEIINETRDTRSIDDVFKFPTQATDKPTVSKKPTPKEISKIKIDARRGMAEIADIEGVTIAKKDLPKDLAFTTIPAGLERIGHIEMIEDLKKKGIGQNYVDKLKTLRKAQGRDTIDIIAKPGSEGFWEKQGFISVKPYLSKDTKDILKTPSMGEKGFLPQKFQAMKLPDFRDAVIDKDGNIKKVDGKEVTPMIFVLNDYQGMKGVSLQDLVAQSKLTEKTKPEYLTLPKKKDSTLKKLDEGTEKKKTKLQHIKDSADSLAKGLDDLSDITQKGAVSPGGDLWDESAYNRAKQHFNDSYESAKKAYNMTLDDYVIAMFKALKNIPKEIRKRIREFLMKWANNKDANLSVRINQRNKVANIVELMGFSGRMKYRMAREIMDSGTMDRLVASLNDNTDNNSDDLTREGLNIADTSDHEEIGNNLTFEGYDFRGDTFFKFLENTDTKGWLDRKQTAKIMTAAISGDKDVLLEHLKDNHNFIPSTIEEENMIQSFWVKNQTINRTTSLEKPSWWWANLDENGRKIRSKSNKRLIPKIGGDSTYGKDIRTNTDLPSTTTMSFVDWAIQSKSHDGEDIKISRIYMKDLVDVWVGKRDETGSKYYGKQEWTNLSTGGRSLVQIWDWHFAGDLDTDSDGNKIIRTVVELKGGGNNPSFVVARIPEEILEMSEDNVLVSEYLENEIEKGNMTSKIANDMIDSINQLDEQYGSANKYVTAQHITTHELMKRSHGARYLMRTTDLLHHMRRASLPYSEGVVPIGLGETTIKILDQSKVTIINEDGKKVPMTELIAGLEGRSRSDGATITDTETLNKIAEHTGRKTVQNGLPMREVKSVIWYNSLNNDFAKKNYPPESFRDNDYWEGIHYLAIKHNEFVADEGLRFIDNDDNLIAYTVRENNEIRIYDADDNRINRLSTLDEAKEPDGGSGSFELKGRPSTDVLTLPEESTRIIKVPGQKSKTSAAFPFSWLSKLYHPDFDNLRNQIEERLLNIAKSNIDAMFQARRNPEIMASLYGQMKNDNTSFISEIEQLIEPEKGNMITDGYNHPHITRGILEPIKNKLINENSYRGRRKGFGNYPVVKPDYDGTKVSRYDGVAISEDDFAMINFIKQKLNLDRGLSGEDLQRAYTEAILGGPRRGAHLLVGRFPVYSPNGVSLLKITNIVPSGHGNVTWFHPDFLAGPLQGDADGDNVFFQIMYFGQNYSDESIINTMLTSKDAFDKRKGFARVEYFKKKDKKLSAVKKKSLYDSSKMIGDGIASQGILTNAITFFEDMNYKGFKANLGGQIVVTKSPDKETSIMLYAPLKNDITQEMLDEANMGKLVGKDGQSWSNGEKYLLTTPSNELRLLLQAAVDHSKELLLSDWGYDGYDFIIPKMFMQENGSPIGKKQSRTISRIIRKFLSHGVTRRGRDVNTRRTKSISSMFEDSKNMFEFINMSTEEQGQYLTSLSNERRNQYKSIKKATTVINSISFNGNITTIEKLISTPYSSMDEYMKENPDDPVWEHPFGYSPHRVINGLLKTKSDLVNTQRREAKWYPENKSWKSKKKEARRFINQMGTEFYRIHSQKVIFDKSSESTLTSAGYPYDDVMLDFIDKWYNKGDKKKGIKAFKDLTDEQKAYSTLRFLRGISIQEKTIKNINKKQVGSLMNNMMKIRARINETNNVKSIENLQNRYKKLQETLDKITTKTILARQPRIRDITTILPKQLMHPDVWRTYAEASGANIREASNEAQRIDNLDEKVYDYITKDCP